MHEEFIWWPAICHQFKIEFGMELETRFGGNIANLMYSIHALVDKALASHAPSATEELLERQRCVIAELRQQRHELREQAIAALRRVTGKAFVECEDLLANAYAPIDAAAQPTKKYERKQVPELTISDEIRLGMRKLCGHLAECDCQNGIFVGPEIEHSDH